jgi:hypothetical protein
MSKGAFDFMKPQPAPPKPLEPWLLPESPNPKRNKPAPAQFEVLKGSLNWAEERSTLTMKQLVRFNDLARAIIVTIVYAQLEQTEACYSEVFSYIENSLVPLLSRYPGLLQAAEEGEEKWGTQTTVIRNLARILPTEQGIELLTDFNKRLKTRAEQLKHPYIAPISKGTGETKPVAEPPAAEPSAPVIRRVALPRSMREALRLGWEVSGSTEPDPKSEWLHKGHVQLSNPHGGHEDSLKVSYVAKYTYGQPEWDDDSK